MNEEFLKKFVGKDIGIVPFGGSMSGGVRGNVVSVDGCVLHLSNGDDGIFIDIDGIMAVIPFGEAIQNEN